MTTVLILLTYVLTFLAGAGAASMLIGGAAIRLARRAQPPRRVVRGGDGAEQLTALHDAVGPS